MINIQKWNLHCIFFWPFSSEISIQVKTHTATKYPTSEPIHEYRSYKKQQKKMNGETSHMRNYKLCQLVWKLCYFLDFYNEDCAPKTLINGYWHRGYAMNILFKKFTYQNFRRIWRLLLIDNTRSTQHFGRLACLNSFILSYIFWTSS